MGGLVIKNVAMFNKELLYKYAWRYNTSKDNILAQIYKEKYGLQPTSSKEGSPTTLSLIGHDGSKE